VEVVERAPGEPEMQPSAAKRACPTSPRKMQPSAAKRACPTSPPLQRAPLAGFDDVWGALSPREQVDLLRLLVARVDYDARDSTIEVSFHADGIRALAAREVEVAA